MIRVERTHLDGVLRIVPPTIFEDFRGSYVELYNEDLYTGNCGPVHFIQDDISTSSKNVLRGIHGDRHTWKLISCLQGKLYLVIVNWNEASAQFQAWEAFTLSGENHLQILVPPRFGVGHLVLSDQAIFHYKQSAYYDRTSQFTLAWNDPRLKIWWPVGNPILSRRDQGLE